MIIVKKQTEAINNRKNHPVIGETTDTIPLAITTKTDQSTTVLNNAIVALFDVFMFMKFLTCFQFFYFLQRFLTRG